MRKEFLSGILSIIKTLPWEKKIKGRKGKENKSPANIGRTGGSEDVKTQPPFSSPYDMDY